MKQTTSLSVTPSGVLIDANAGTNSVTFDASSFDVIGLVLVSTGTITGDWTATASCDHTDGAEFNVPTRAGTFASITALVKPAFTAVTTAAAQYVQIQGIDGALFAARTVTLTFTKTGGTGTVSAFMFAKGNT